MKKASFLNYLSKNGLIDSSLDFNTFEIEPETFLKMLLMQTRYVNYLSKEQMDCVINKSDMKLYDKDERSVLSIVLSQQIVDILSDNQLLNIIKKSDLNFPDQYKNYPIHYYLYFNRERGKIKNKEKSINYLVEHSPHKIANSPLIHFLRHRSAITQSVFDKLVELSHPVSQYEKNRLTYAIRNYDELMPKSKTSKKGLPLLKPEHFPKLMQGIINNPINDNIFKETVLDLEAQCLSLIWPYIEDKNAFVELLEKHNINILNKEIFTNPYLKSFIEKRRIEVAVNTIDNKKVLKL